MTGTGTRGARLSAVSDLFARGDDPYAGADPTTSRTAVAVLSLLHGALILGFLPLFPPVEGLGPAAGWIVAAAVVLVGIGAGVALLLERREVRFNVLLALTYAGIGEILLVQFLAQSVLPYQLFLLIWVGAAAVQPARRAVAVLVVLLFATLAPLALTEGTIEDRDTVGRALLFAAVGLVLIVYVNYVRAQRLSLQRQERYARTEADAATKRVRDLQWITDATLARRDLDDLLDELLERITRVFEAGYGAILLSVGDGRRLELGALRGVSSPVGNQTEFAEQDFASRVAAERAPLAVERSRGEGSPTSGAGPRSLLGVPLLVSARTIGVLYVGTRSPRRFSEADIALLELVGDRVALAIDSARLFERERHIAETLQRSLLPELRHVPGTTVAVRYQPAGGGVEVGGDWYDMLELDDGRIVLAMGDVVGRGVRAAALMGKLRTALEAYALDGHSPGSVLQRLHSLMERQHRSEIATLFCVIVDPDDGSAEFANAGHLPALVRSPDGNASFLGAAKAPPLGALPYSRFGQESAQIPFDSTILLFTDGLVEQPGVSIELRLEALRRIVEAGPADAEELCDAVMTQMLIDVELGDDVALLAFTLSSLPRQGFMLELPAEPEALASIRTALERWLKQTGACQEDVYAIKVACGEACANAIEHAYRPGDAAFRLEATLGQDAVQIVVHDYGTWREQRGVDRGRGLALMEALMDSIELAPSATGTTVRLRRHFSPHEGP
jgi:anti-sigma regulatory factor (Ser/Thr protein kinase)